MNYNTIGERIKHHRKRLGMTQEQLAERIGVSAQAVSKWENNLSCPDISILPELAEIFGISTDELLGKQETVHTAEPITAQKKPQYQWYWNISSIAFAVFVLLFGGLWLMNELCGFDVSWWTLLWTLSLVYFGALTLRNGFSAIGLIMLLTGTGFLLSAYELVHIQMRWSLVIPCCVIIWGLGLLVDMFGKKTKLHRKHKQLGINKGTPQREYSCADGNLHCEMSFGEARVAVVTPLLRGGSVETNFGNFTVDFSGCEALAPNCRIAVDNNFAKLVLLVPDRFRVQTEEHDSFAASVQINGASGVNTDGVMLLNCDNNFGTLEIKYV